MDTTPHTRPDPALRTQRGGGLWLVVADELEAVAAEEDRERELRLHGREVVPEEARKIEARLRDPAQHAHAVVAKIAVVSREAFAAGRHRGRVEVHGPAA